VSEPETSVTLSSTPPDLPLIVHRYLNGESIQDIAKDFGVVRRTIYNWLHRSHSDPEYKELQRQAYVARIADADDALHTATDAVLIARAREEAKFARWDAERRLPDLFGLKQDHSEAKTIVIVNRSMGIGQVEKKEDVQVIEMQGQIDVE
jgi:transposase